MAHGAGGKATQTLIEGLLAPAFASDSLERARPTPGSGGRRASGSRMTTDTTSSSRCASPAARSASSPSTARSTTSRRRAPCRSRSASRWCSRRASSRGPARRGRGDRRRGPGRRGRDGHRRHEGGRARSRRRHVRDHDRDRAHRPARATLSPAALSPATGCSSRGRSASTGPRSCSPEASSASRPRSSPTRARCGRSPSAARGGRRRLRTMRDATRGGVATVLNELARASGVGISVAEADDPGRPEVTGACELLGIDPMYVANEGVMVAFVAPDGRTLRSRRCTRSPGARRRRRLRRSGRSRPGWCWSRRRSAAGG